MGPVIFHRVGTARESSGKVVHIAVIVGAAEVSTTGAQEIDRQRTGRGGGEELRRAQLSIAKPEQRIFVVLLEATGNELQISAPGQIHARRYGSLGQAARFAHVPVEIIQHFR